MILVTPMFPNTDMVFTVKNLEDYQGSCIFLTHKYSDDI